MFFFFKTTYVEFIKKMIFCIILCHFGLFNFQCELPPPLDLRQMVHLASHSLHIPALTLMINLNCKLNLLGSPDLCLSWNWFLSWFIIKWCLLESWCDMNHYIWKSLESWVDSNHFLGSRGVKFSPKSVPSTGLPLHQVGQAQHQVQNSFNSPAVYPVSIRLFILSPAWA